MYLGSLANITVPIQLAEDTTSVLLNRTSWANFASSLFGEKQELTRNIKTERKKEKKKEKKKEFFEVRDYRK